MTRRQPVLWLLVAALIAIAATLFTIAVRGETDRADTADKDKAQAQAVALFSTAELRAACEDPKQRAVLASYGIPCSKVEQAAAAVEEDTDVVLVPGPPGPAGDDGRTGIPGRPGLTGLPGDDGTRGPRGFTGLDGPVGPPGADGSNGTNGTDGETGTQGQQGATGAQGPAGPPGPPGADGAPGQPGTDGQDGAPGQIPDGTYDCTDGEVMTGFDVTAGVVTVHCKPQLLP